MLAVAAGQAAQVWFRSEVDLPAPDATTPLLAALVGTVLFFVLWPFFAAPRLRAHRSTWYTAALAPLVGFVALYRPFEIAFPDAKGLLPIALGAVSVGALAAMRRVGPTAADVRRSATVWFAGVAIVFVSAAIPIQLEKQWITIGWAVEGMALLFLWRRLDHAGLKWVAFALLAATATRLVVNPYVLEYGDRGAHIVNWLLYTYWVPVVAMLFGMRALGSLEAERVRDRERLLYGKDGRPVLQVLLGAMAVALVFAWLNLTIADYFSPGRDIELSFERQPAKDLTTSISWGAYALMLLGLGVWRQSKGLRWTSLLLLVVTLLKLVFWDLSTLEGLYRVLSFLGLGVSLVIVSLVYQRFLSSKSVAARAAHEGEP
ncbi:MAG: DUF2339 domain-containing protein, partial [Myxococcales bacterium]|nr:DUF2339 domain-containing protein [Myxococcales bacterium]